MQFRRGPLKYATLCYRTIHLKQRKVEDSTTASEIVVYCKREKTGFTETLKMPGMRVLYYHVIKGLDLRGVEVDLRGI
jgi:hypothetical protein